MPTFIKLNENVLNPTLTSNGVYQFYAATDVTINRFSSVKINLELIVSNWESSTLWFNLRASENLSENCVNIVSPYFNTNNPVLTCSASYYGILTEYTIVKDTLICEAILYNSVISNLSINSVNELSMLQNIVDIAAIYKRIEIPDQIINLKFLPVSVEKLWQVAIVDQFEIALNSYEVFWIYMPLAELRQLLLLSADEKVQFHFNLSTAFNSNVLVNCYQSEFYFKVVFCTYNTLNTLVSLNGVIGELTCSVFSNLLTNSAENNSDKSILEDLSNNGENIIIDNSNGLLKIKFCFF